MKDKNILLAAKLLFNHRLNKTGLKDLPADLKPSDIEESYLIQNELKILYLTLKDNYCIGKKVGCTNKHAQDQVNVFEPFYGNLFSKFSDKSSCKLKSSKFFNPYIEPEVSVRLKKDININDYPFKFENSKDLAGIIWHDHIISIDWQFERYDIDEKYLKVSDRDKRFPYFRTWNPKTLWK